MSSPSSTSPITSLMFDDVFESTTAPVSNSPARHLHVLFNEKTLSDVRIDYGADQHIFGHKAILARQSEYFFRAFTGEFPVASSENISLGDDDDPKAIYAMIRHLYELPYDQTTVLFPNSLNTDLLFHINVFEAADKYDVPSLRVLVVDKFSQLMKQTWSTKQEEFCKAIRRLCAPDAVSFADRSLQVSAATFCSANIMDLIKIDGFVQMLEEGEPFAGRLLTAVLKGKAATVIQTMKCSRCATLTDSAVQANLSRRCVGCSAVHQPFGAQRYKDFLPL